MTTLRESLRALPKTELHLHALGALRPATVVEWARRRNAPVLAAAERAARQGYDFEHLSQFGRRREDAALERLTAPVNAQDVVP